MIQIITCAVTGLVQKLFLYLSVGSEFAEIWRSIKRHPTNPNPTMGTPKSMIII